MQISHKLTHWDTNYKYHFGLKMTQFYSFVHPFDLPLSFSLCACVFFFLASHPRQSAFSLTLGWKRSPPSCHLLSVSLPLSTGGTMCMPLHRVFFFSFFLARSILFTLLVRVWSFLHISTNQVTHSDDMVALFAKEITTSTNTLYVCVRVCTCKLKFSQTETFKIVKVCKRR